MATWTKNPFTKPIGRQRGVVGLDIEADSIAATEVQVNGAVTVSRYDVAALPSGAMRDGEVQDPVVLGDAIKDMFTSQKLPRDVRIGIANQRVAVRTLRLPLIEDPSELDTAVRFAAQEHIPMPLDRAILDWQVIPPAPGRGGEGVEVVAVAARRDMLSVLMEAVRRAGLRLVGIDHASFALIRALKDPSTVAAPPTDEAAQEGVQVPAGTLYCHLGDITNLAVARESYCVFSRVLGFGVEGIAQSLAAKSTLSLEHARQWLLHVGLEDPIDQITGDPEIVTVTRDSLVSGTATLIDELRRSLEYYAAFEDAVRVDDVVVAGPGTAIPGLVAQLERELPVPLKAVVPEALRTVPARAARRLTLSYGLGLSE